MNEPPFSFIFDLKRLGSSAARQSIVADEAGRRGVVKLLSLADLARLEGDMTVEPWHGTGVRVAGRIRADAVQSCVITLEPVPEKVDSDFAVTFLPPEAMAVDPKTVAEAEVIVVFDEEDPPDPLEGTTIDLGAILTEQLALALDPYPRAPGASWPEEGKGDDAAESSPFAALAKLRDK